MCILYTIQFYSLWLSNSDTTLRNFFFFFFLCSFFTDTCTYFPSCVLDYAFTHAYTVYFIYYNINDCLVAFAIVLPYSYSLSLSFLSCYIVVAVAKREEKKNRVICCLSLSLFHWLSVFIYLIFSFRCISTAKHINFNSFASFCVLENRLIFIFFCCVVLFFFICSLLILKLSHLSVYFRNTQIHSFSSLFSN